MNHGVAMDRIPIQLLRSDALARSGVDPTVLARLARRHVLHRVSAGRYAEIRDWGSLSELERHRLCVMAVASTTASDPVFSHHAAAALWRIPLLGHWPSKVDVTVPSASGGRSTGQIRRHCRASFPPPVAQIDGMLVTTLARTAADLARALPFRDAVAVIDAVLSPSFGDHTPTRAAIADELASDPGGRGIRTARAALAFSTHLSESVWESASRRDRSARLPPSRPAAGVPVVEPGLLSRRLLVAGVLGDRRVRRTREVRQRQRQLG
jgi:hypothetical protein